MKIPNTKKLIIVVAILSFGFTLKGEITDSTSIDQLLLNARQNKKDSNYNQSIDQYYKALNIIFNDSTNKDDNLCAEINLELGNLLYQNGFYSKAMEAYLKGIQCSERNKNSNKTLLNGLYLNTGVIYSTFEDHEQALIFYQKGYQNAITLGNKNLQFSYLNNMVASACYTGRFADAKKYNKIAQDIAIRDSLHKEFVQFFNMGFIATAEKKDLAALIYFNKSIKLAEKNNMAPILIAGAYSELYKSFENSNLPDSAILYLEKCREICETNNYVNVLVESYKGLARLYEQINDSKTSLYYQNKYVQLSDSLMNIREFYSIRNKQISYEESKNKSYVEMLSSTIFTQKIILIILISFLFVFTILIILFYLQKNKLQKSYNRLYNKNKELIRAEYKYNEALNEISKLKELAFKEQKETTTTSSVDQEPYKQNLLSEDHKEQLLKKIKLVMDTTQKFCNPEFSLAMLANLVNSNTKYVSQIINETYEKNFRAFINEYRIKESIKMLMDSENYGHYSIKGIAENVGYKSQSNFIDAFRKNTGITPSMYQKMAKKKVMDN